MNIFEPIRIGFDQLRVHKLRAFLSILDGAENILMPGIEHSGDNGLQDDLGTYQELARVLQYDRVY